MNTNGNRKGMYLPNFNDDLLNQKLADRHSHGI